MENPPRAVGGIDAELARLERDSARQQRDLKHVESIVPWIFGSIIVGGVVALGIPIWELYAAEPAWAVLFGFVWAGLWFSLVFVRKLIDERREGLEYSRRALA